MCLLDTTVSVIWLNSQISRDEACRLMFGWDTILIALERYFGYDFKDLPCGYKSVRHYFGEKIFNSRLGCLLKFRLMGKYCVFDNVVL